MSAVHINPWSELPAESLVQQGFFEVVEGGELLAVDGKKPVLRFKQLVDLTHDALLIGE